MNPAKMITALSLKQVHALTILAFAASAAAVVAPWRWLPALNWLWSDTIGSAAETSAGTASLNTYWPIRFLANLVGYASALLPLYLAVRLARTWDYDHKGPRLGLLPGCIRALALQGGTAASSKQDDKLMLASGASQGIQPQERQQQQQQQSYSVRWCLHLTVCFLGLQAAYLTWGLLQERMMTFDYNGEHFRDSQFLVFANRALGGLLAVPLMLLTQFAGTRRSDLKNKKAAPTSSAAADRRQSPPAFEYVYSSVSNILSSWCQYEALVYVTFPTQVLTKASKIIPVMLMGRLVSRKAYQVNEYFTAGLISAGTALFLLSSPDVADSTANAQTVSPGSSSSWQHWTNPISGATLLAGYLVFDAFTSSWQSRLFGSHKSSPLQMLAGSSLASCLATVAAQLQQGSLASALAFAYRHPLFASHLCLLSLCSTLGQLVIFHTIDKFGPVTFTIIMTVRQAFAILVSCLAYQHRLSSNAQCGVGVVFVALFLRIYFAQRPRKTSSTLGVKRD